MKIAVLGTTPMTVSCIFQFIKKGWEVAAVISLPESNRPLNSVDLKGISDEIGAVYYETEELNSRETELFLKQMELDYIFSTWPYIIKDNILNVPKYFVIGSHPTQLPYNRGRHPLHWLISMGIKESFISLFIMDSGVDSGNILIQEQYSCACDYGIQEVYENMLAASNRAIGQLCDKLEKNPLYQGMVQDDSKANYWRKRNIFDVIIDCRMRAVDIQRLVKSFNKPYECAVLVYKDNMIRVTDAQIMKSTEGEDSLQRMETGKIVRIEENSISVKASDQIIQLFADTDIRGIQFGKYIYPPAKYVMEEPELFQKLSKYVQS